MEKAFFNYLYYKYQVLPHNLETVYFLELNEAH